MPLDARPPHSVGDRRSDQPASDVVIIGDGLIGLSTAYELARAGVACCLVGARHDGVASEAAAGLLSPSVGALASDVRAFFQASMARYPALVDALRSFDSQLRLVPGLIEVGATQEPVSAGALRLSSEDLARLEPALSAPSGALLHSADGAVDNVRLVRALRQAVAREARVRWVTNDPVVRVDVASSSSKAQLASGAIVSAPTMVLAAGAWAPFIEGLPRPLPVSPLKGQMLAVRSTLLNHPIMADHVYLVPRVDEIVIGATVEDAGFDTTTEAVAIAGLRDEALLLCPALDDAPVIRQWAGIRPATPDLLPIIGPDPEAKALLYAGGHSRNGILLAPATASAIARLVQGLPAELDISPFSIDRFATR